MLDTLRSCTCLEFSVKLPARPASCGNPAYEPESQMA
jgi:hypothetical protein